MKLNHSAISRNEANLLFCFTLAGLLIRIINLVVSTVFAPARNGVSFGIYDIFHMKEMMSPMYSFIVFIICVPLAWKINSLRSLLSLFPLLLLTLFFDYWFIQTRQDMAYTAINNSNFEFKTFDFALIGGTIYDLLTLLLTNVLFIWQVTILVRFSRFNRRLTSAATI